MKVELTPRLLILAASIAGLVACEKPEQRVQEEKKDLVQEQNEAAKERADLAREQAKERADLERKAGDDIAEERRDLAEAERGAGTPMVGDKPADEQREVNRELEARNEKVGELNEKQRKERADLVREQKKERAEEREDLVEARKDLNEERAEIVKDSRDKLRDLDERAAKLQKNIETASAETRTQVTSALTGFPTERKAVERDIDAINTVQEANLKRAKDKVQKELSSLDKRLDRAESLD